MPLAATMGGANGVHHHHSNNGNGAAAAWAASCAVDAAAAHRQLYSADPSAQHPPQSQPQSTASSPPRHNHSSNGSYNNNHHNGPTAREAKVQAVADEWGFSDARMAATLLKRQEKMRKLQRDSERRKHKQDPIKRLEKLQGQLSHQYVPPHQASQPQPASTQPIQGAASQPASQPAKREDRTSRLARAAAISCSIDLHVAIVPSTGYCRILILVVLPGLLVPVVLPGLLVQWYTLTSPAGER